LAATAAFNPYGAGFHFFGAFKGNTDCISLGLVYHGQGCGIYACFLFLVIHMLVAPLRLTGGLNLGQGIYIIAYQLDGLRMAHYHYVPAGQQQSYGGDGLHQNAPFAGIPHLIIIMAFWILLAFHVSR